MGRFLGVQLYLRCRLHHGRRFNSQAPVFGKSCCGTKPVAPIMLPNDAKCKKKRIAPQEVIMVLMIWNGKDQTHPVEWHFYRHLRAHRCGLSTTDETRRCPRLQSRTVLKQPDPMKDSDFERSATVAPQRGHEFLDSGFGGFPMYQPEYTINICIIYLSDSTFTPT
jgi:hypothetical protein